MFGSVLWSRVSRWGNHRPQREPTAAVLLVVMLSKCPIKFSYLCPQSNAMARINQQSFLQQWMVVTTETSMCWLGFTKFAQARVILVKRTSAERENASVRLACGQTCGSIFQINDLYKSVQPIVGGANPGQVILECIRKLFEQASKQHSSIHGFFFQLPAFSPYPGFPLQWTTSVS